MKKLIFLTLTAIISFGCGGSNTSAPTQVNNNANVTSSAPKKDEMTVRSHTTENQKPEMGDSKGGSSTGSGGSPMQQAVDLTEMTANIEKADKEFKAKPNDTKAKEALAAAYFERADALTKAAQYSAALGDYRKGLKLDPTNGSAKGMHDQIVEIYQSMGREVPKEGEEKAPLTSDKK